MGKKQEYSENTWSPSSTELPRHDVKHGSIEALQAEHNLHIEHDGLYVERVEPMQASQEEFLVNIEPFPHIDCTWVLSDIVILKLWDPLAQAWCLNEMLVVRVVKSLLSPKWYFSLNLLKVKKLTLNQCWDVF